MSSWGSPSGTDDRSSIYSYEQRHAATLDPESERGFRRNTKAWDFFQARPPSYRKAAIYWVTSAKREETRRKRLVTLIEDSANGRTVPPLTPPAKRS
ncbi:MAG: YdeI/OmpD-associated family protein [Actinomycetota bacterium]